MRTITTFLLCIGLAILGNYAEAVVISRTTEYHALAMSLTADKTQNIILPDGVFATGFVKDQAGHPVHGAFVSAERLEGQVAAVGGTTDATGKFTIPVQPGTYTFYVTPPVSASVVPSQFSRLLRGKLENIPVTADTSVGTITLANGFIVSGNILPPSGAIGIFSGVFWTFPSPGGPIGYDPAKLGTPPSGSNQYAIALAPGAYKSVVIPILVYSSTFQQLAVAFATTPFTVAGDKTLNVKLRKGFLLSGTVVDTANRPLTGFVWIYQKGAGYEPGVYVGLGLVASGKYQTYLPPGNYSAVFVPYAAPTYTGRAATTSQDLVMPAANKILNFVAHDGVILSGIVKDAHNHLVKTSGIMLRGSANNPWGPSQITYAAFAVVNTAGKYRITVPAGTYDLVGFPQTGIVKTSHPDFIQAISTARRIISGADSNH